MKIFCLILHLVFWLGAQPENVCVLCMLSSYAQGFYFEEEEKSEATFGDSDGPSDEFLWPPEDMSE